MYLSDNESAYYLREVRTKLDFIKDPEFPTWFSPAQISPRDIMRGDAKHVKWTALAKAEPTKITANEVNTISEIAYKADIKTISYSKLQYEFRHKDKGESFLHNPMYGQSDPINNLLPYGDAFKLVSGDIIDKIDEYILTGSVKVELIGGGIDFKSADNIKGLLNLDSQIDEEVTNTDKDKPDKIVEKVKEGLRKLQLGTYRRTPMQVLIAENVADILDDQYNPASPFTWADILIRKIAIYNSKNPVYYTITPKLSHKILIYPQSPDLMMFEPSKYMMPMPDKFTKQDSGEVEFSYANFVFGGLIAHRNIMVRVNIKQTA